MSTITQASKEWATRPADERFANLDDLYAKAQADCEGSTTRTVSLRALRVTTDFNAADTATPVDKLGGLRFALGDTEVQPTAHAFEQVCRIVSAPPAYLQTLPAPIAADALRHNLFTHLSENGERGYSALLTKNDDGSTKMRAITSTGYTRVWDAEAVSSCRSIGGGWRVPPARPVDPNSKSARVATADDVLSAESFGLSVKEGDMIDHAGLYRGDRDFFMFMVNPERNFDDGAGNAISRAFMFWGSEVGARSIGFRACGYKHVCGNHILWDAQDILNVRRIHRGVNVRSVFEEIKSFLQTYTDSSTSRETVMIAAARLKDIAATRDEVIEKVASLANANKKLAIDAFNKAEETYSVHRASPRSFWGMVEGLTYISQRESNADRRVLIDGVAGKLLAMAA